MYSRANVRVESVLRPPTRALPSVIVDVREAGRGKTAHGWKGVRPGCASKPDGESREEPEEHKHNDETAYIQARSSVARALEINGKACQAEGVAKVVY